METTKIPAINKLRGVFLSIGRLAPLIIFIVLWELAIHRNPSLAFFFGAPSRILALFVARVSDGSLVADFVVTLSEVTVGFLLGNIIGTALGLAFWFSRTVLLIARPYVIALGSAPLITLAPLIIVWFGTGYFSKVVVVGFSTVFVALFQAHTGTVDVNAQYLRVMQTFKASKIQTFRKVI